MFCETWDKDIKNIIPKDMKFPKNAYAFEIYEQENIVDGEKVFIGEAKRIGPMYYHPDSKIETLAQVKGNPNASKTLISNMECNKWDKVIWTRWNNWPQPYKKGRMKILEQ